VQARQFSELINNPSALKKEHLPELQQLVQDFPYFQSAHLLLNLAAKQFDSGMYEKILQRTAIVVTNRSHLFHLMNTALQMPVTETAVKAEEKVVEVKAAPVEELSRSAEIKQELNILKATEAAHEAADAVEVVAEPLAPADLESEIAKQVVVSIVDKEIINAKREVDAIPVKNEADDFKPASFTDWLAYIKKNNGEPYQQIVQKVEKAKAEKMQLKGPEIAPNEDKNLKKQKNKALIDKIIDVNPGSIKIKEDQKFYQPDTKAKESLLENEHLVTETLAKIYALQGNTAKAIRAYQILSLKFPQKSVYFATLIQKLKNNE
jgi:tetratricopeptide (TPR) repeat protein